MARRVATDPEAKARALQLAEQHGAAEASRQTGIPAGTIRAWRARSAEVVTPASTDADSVEQEIERLALCARKARDVAEQALDRLAEVLPLAKSPQSIVIAAGVATDKAAQLEAQIATLEERRVRIDEERGDLIVELVRLFFEAVGVPFTAPAKKLFATLLRQAGNAEQMMVAAEYAGPARAAIRAVFEKELRRELRDRLREELRDELEAEIRERLVAEAQPDWTPPARLELPAPSDEHDDDEPGEMAGPRRVVRTVEPEVVDGEVVDDQLVIPPHLQAEAARLRQRHLTQPWLAEDAIRRLVEEHERSGSDGPSWGGRGLSVDQFSHPGARW